jgi:hypothetical protein
MPRMTGTAGEWFDRHDEVNRRLSERRHGLRPLAVAQCGRDSRLLGAVYVLKDGMWLWHRVARLTQEESQREYLGNAANEYDTLIENGEDRAESWAATLGRVSEEGFRFPDRSEPEFRVEKLSDLKSAVRFYRASSLAEISRVDRELTGTFSSCPEGRDPALASAPAYGLVNSWQATQWQLC